MTTKVGYCKYCKNGRVIEVAEDADQELVNEIASEECNCYGAEDARKKKYQKDVCLTNIHEMLEAQHPEIAEVLRDCIDAMQERKIKKITINTYGNFTVKMHTNKDGIKIEIEKKMKEESLA